MPVSHVTMQHYCETSLPKSTVNRFLCFSQPGLKSASATLDNSRKVLTGVNHPGGEGFGWSITKGIKPSTANSKIIGFYRNGSDAGEKVNLDLHLIIY